MNGQAKRGWLEINPQIAQIPPRPTRTHSVPIALRG
jgi:hypothetical protein